MIESILSLAILGSNGAAAPAAPKPKPASSADLKPSDIPPPGEPQLTLPVDTPITVLDYDAKTNTFLLSLDDEPAVGPNYATPEDLHRAIGFTGSFDSFTKQRGQMIGSLYQLKRPCPLIKESEMLIRNKKARAGEPADSAR